MKRTLLSAAPFLLLLSSCAKDINNKEALRAAMLDYYSGNLDKLGLLVSQMEVEIGSMSFQKDRAQATVLIKMKGGSGGADGMQLSKTFERKGDKWVVSGTQSSGPGGHGAGQALPGSDPLPARALPPGHPPAGAPAK